MFVNPKILVRKNIQTMTRQARTVCLNQEWDPLGPRSALAYVG